MLNISGFNSFAVLTATGNFPLGVILTQFADDTDVIESPSIRIGEAAMGVNGDLIVWNPPVIVPLNLSVIASSQDDQILQILLLGNKVGKSKTAARDIINLVITYPANQNALPQTATYTNGILVEGPPSMSVASEGRFKTNTYQFLFEEVTRTS